MKSLEGVYYLIMDSKEIGSFGVGPLESSLALGAVCWVAVADFDIPMNEFDFFVFVTRKVLRSLCDVVWGYLFLLH